jgi:hypothetical protein
VLIHFFKLALVLFTTGLLTPNLVFAQAQVSQAEAIELSSHRIERLANIKKIESSFLNKLEKIELFKGTGATFKLTASQFPGPDGKVNQIDIFLDSVGKAAPFDLTHLRIGTESPTAPSWPDRDAVTIIENAIHLVEAGKADPTLKLYFDGLVGISLAQITSTSGEILGRVLMKSELTPQSLEVLMKLDGTVDSSRVLP